MPVDSSFNVQVVPHKHFQIVSFLDFDERARLLTVDKVYLTRESICATVNQQHQKGGFPV